MKRMMYRPSEKGLKTGLSIEDRVLVNDKQDHLIWLKTDGNKLWFEGGDICEYKPSKKKSLPDSLWIADKIIDPISISGIETISEYTMENYSDMLNHLGFCIPNQH